MSSDFLGRKYYHISDRLADELHSLRQSAFDGNIDFNQCASQSYEALIKSEAVWEKGGPLVSNQSCQEDLFFLVKYFRGYDTGYIWVVNNLTRVIMYEGVRSVRLIDVLKNINSDNPLYFTKQEYENLIELHFKFYGPYFFKDVKSIGKITESEAKYCTKILEEYHEQILKERRARVPKFGDIVRTISGEFGRFLKQNQALIKEDDVLKRDFLDMEADWSSDEKNFLPTDEDLVKYIKESNFFSS